MEGYICQSSSGAQSFPTLRHKLPTLTTGTTALCYVRQMLWLLLVKQVVQGSGKKPANIAFTRTGEIGLFWNYLVSGRVVGSPPPAGEVGVSILTNQWEPFSMNITAFFGVCYLGIKSPEDYIAWAEEKLLAG